MALIRSRYVIAVVILVLVAVAAFLFFRGKGPGPEEPRPGPLSEEERLARGKEVFDNHCAACHGEKGDGQGTAAKFVYPRPRNFGEGKFRIVSTVNAYPSDADLMHVITNGMPGSAMFPFGHLPEEDRQALVAHIRRLIRSSVEEQLRQSAAASGQQADDAWLAPRIARLTKVGEPLAVPADLPAPGPDSVKRGAELYVSKGCVSCHGPTGKGDGVQDQKNADGTPTRPRDFTRGIFKGGRDPKQLYARLMLGMPGSPMPASENVQPAEAGDMINFMLSLSDPSAQELVAHRRRTLTARRAAGELPDDIPEETWKTAETVPIVVTPLWWREYDEPALKVAALHDGKSLALRLTWQDRSKNDSAVRPEEFEDMAAVQLFKGAVEPFLGMGAVDRAIDLWLWRAGWANPTARPDSLLDDYPFDTPLYAQLTKGKEKGIPDFLTARAAGNQQAHGDPKQSAGSLTAKGFGSTTFRPPVSQLVKASSSYTDGRWTVVLRRPLGVGADDGLSLTGGERCSIAFAVWDGEYRDRNGQKLVSIWHDLKLE